MTKVHGLAGASDAPQNLAYPHAPVKRVPAPQNPAFCGLAGPEGYGLNMRTLRDPRPRMPRIQRSSVRSRRALIQCVSAGILTLTVACKDETRTTTTVPEPGGRGRDRPDAGARGADSIGGDGRRRRRIPILPPHKASSAAPGGRGVADEPVSHLAPWTSRSPSSAPDRSLTGGCPSSLGPLLRPRTPGRTATLTFVALANNTLDPDDPTRRPRDNIRAFIPDPRRALWRVRDGRARGRLSGAEGRQRSLRGVRRLHRLRQAEDPTRRSRA